MRISRATNSANEQPTMLLAPWMDGGISELDLKRGADVLIVDLSIKYAPQSNGQIASLKTYKEQLSEEIGSGKFIKDLVAKLQGIDWGDVPNPQGTLVRVLLPEGVTFPDAIDLEKVRGLPSWVRGAIQFKAEPFKQPSAAQQELFEQLYPPKLPNNSVPAD